VGKVIVEDQKELRQFPTRHWVLICPNLATPGLEGSAIKREVLSRTVPPCDSRTHHPPSSMH